MVPLFSAPSGTQCACGAVEVLWIRESLCFTAVCRRRRHTQRVLTVVFLVLPHSLDSFPPSSGVGRRCRVVQVLVFCFFLQRVLLLSLWLSIVRCGIKF